MPSKTWDAASSESWLVRTSKLGVLGFYTHCEVTEVVGYSAEQPLNPVNIFSIGVLEDRLDEPARRPIFLNPRDNRIVLRTLKGWTFGVVRYTILVEQLLSAIGHYVGTSEWSLGGIALSLGDVVPVAPQFVPPDATESASLNQLLKNNFWNGSYILEWFDGSKRRLTQFFDEPRRLQELSEAVQQYVPLQLGSMSDRLGNLIIQLPATALMAKFRKTSDETELMVEVAWHSKTSPRPLRATCAMSYDGAFLGYGVKDLEDGQINLHSGDSSGLNQGVVWDDQHKLILAATGPLSYIREVSFKMQIADPEPRIFTITRADSISEAVRINLTNSQGARSVGVPDPFVHRDWTRKRIYAEETVRLMQDRRFVQYQPKSGMQDEGHKKAINDLRFLLTTYGEKGAWLWDPYLDANDVLDTLFHCQHSGADLRALTWGKEIQNALPPAGSDKALPFTLRQRAVLDGANSNCRGLNLEFRAKIGQAGWGFHDRFMVFAETKEGPMAWSLGTSVNSLGKEHHILQRVDNGRLIVDAFLDLWQQLDKPEHLVWKTR